MTRDREPITYLLRHPGCVTGLTESGFEVAMRKAVEAGPGVAVVPLFEADRARRIEDWHEDMGDVLWWTNPVSEAPYVGSPLDIGRGYTLSIGEFETVVHLGGWPGYHEWWTPLPALPTEWAPAPPPDPLLSAHVDGRYNPPGLTRPRIVEVHDGDGST